MTQNDKKQHHRQLPEDYDLGYTANVGTTEAENDTIPEIYY